MFGVRTLRIKSSVLASTAAVATVAAAIAAGATPEVATKGDRLPMPVLVSCEGGACTPPAAPTYRTEVEHDRADGVTTLTRIPVETD